MKKKIVTCFHMGLLLLILVSHSVFAQEGQPKGYTVKSEVVVTVDGIKLATDVYLPEKPGNFPVILARTPYNKDNIKGNVAKFIEKGYVVVSQDCRGKFKSDGVFYPFINEREDGLTTVEWIKKQPWANGKIAGYGGSYGGYTQWAVSDKLDVVLADLTGADVYKLLYPNGLFSLETAFNWGMVVDAKMANPLLPDKLKKSYWYLPLSIADDSTYKDNLFINDWVKHEKRDAYWDKQYNQGLTKGSVLSIAGWYDIFLLAQLDDFVKMDKAQMNPDNRIVIGPWGHGSQGFVNDYGGSKKTGQRAKLQDNFLSKYMLGENVEPLQPPFTTKKYNLFIMERNEYFGCDEWPPKEAIFTNYFLSDKSVIQKESKQNGSVGYQYDPSKPFPSLGGTALGIGVGPALQNPSKDRKDQAVFESEKLNAPLIFAGPVSVSLYASSDARETEFYVLLQDVFPDGNIINIQEGGQMVEFKSASEIKKVEFESWPTGYQINPGHQLRIVVSSSWFPRFNRNLNTGEDAYNAKTSKLANQKIYFGKKYPSKVTLPILTIK